MNDETAAPERSPDRRSGRDRRGEDFGYVVRLGGEAGNLRSGSDRRSDSVPVEVEDGERERMAEELERMADTLAKPWMHTGDQWREGHAPYLTRAAAMLRTRPPEPISPESVARLREALERIATDLRSEGFGVRFHTMGYAVDHAREIASAALAPEEGDDDAE